ncbi:hypothetical protein STVIR_4113 [Streptomyces viridochromogenes Tue57]|uniref:Uncharacterized protein n=1 Tax=Streptomyces viridochromogenes Tue57 TaxID=1160705 RepID=L8PHQ9_STRVR|nr:hypothetical protein STVIR_4113 [Streptomyces viridochromogenes Tue57]
MVRLAVAARAIRPSAVALEALLGQMSKAAQEI